MYHNGACYTVWCWNNTKYANLLLRSCTIYSIELSLKKLLIEWLQIRHGYDIMFTSVWPKDAAYMYVQQSWHSCSCSKFTTNLRPRARLDFMKSTCSYDSKWGPTHTERVRFFEDVSLLPSLRSVCGYNTLNLVHPSAIVVNESLSDGIFSSWQSKTQLQSWKDLEAMVEDGHWSK